MSYVPPSRRGGDFKSRAEGESIPTLADANAKTDGDERRTKAPSTGSWDRAPAPAPQKKSLSCKETACAFLARGGTCRDGDACKFSHDEQVIKAFVDSGGLEKFASKRAKADAAKAEAEAAEKAAKKEARRLARAGPQGPQMRTSGSSADVVEAGSGWAYAGTGGGVVPRKKMATVEPPPPMKVEQSQFSLLTQVDDESDDDITLVEGGWADSEELKPAQKEESESESESEDEEEEPQSKPKRTAAPVPTKKLSKKELKKLEDEEFERQLMEATAGSAPAKVADAAPAGESAAAKKKRLKKLRQKEAKAKEAAAAAATAAAAGKEDESSAPELTEEQKLAKLAKLQQAAAKKQKPKKTEKKKGKMTEKEKAKLAKEKKKAKRAAAQGSPASSPVKGPDAVLA